MSDGKKADALANFQAITSCDEDRARFYMESSNYNLDTALTNYYDDNERETRNDPDHVDEIPGAGAQQSSQSSHSGSPSSKNKKMEKKTVIKSTGNVRTLSSLQNQEADPDSSEDEEGQAFYAGGSEFSGQQVLGPPRRRGHTDLVTDMFRSIREFGAEVVESRQNQSQVQSRIFSGTGYRLGETPTDSQAIPSSDAEDQSQIEITLKFWKNGFSVNDGPLRSYDDPKSKDFLHHIKHGEVPTELLMQAQGREISFNMEDNRHADYACTAAKLVSFSGTGQKLGSVTPILASPAPAPAPASDASAKSDNNEPSNPVQVDSSRPFTTVQIRLANGSRLVGTFNYNHTIADIRSFIDASSPLSRERGYMLLSSFPRKELVNNEETIEQSGLINSVVVQHFVS